MADTIKLSENNFKTVPAGEDIVLSIKSVVGKPKKDPKVVEVTYEHESGAKIVNKYDLNNDKALFALSCVIRATLTSNMNEFSVSKDGPAMVGKKVLCEVVHNESSNGNVFANIRKTKRYTEPEVEEVEEEEDDL